MTMTTTRKPADLKPLNMGSMVASLLRVVDTATPEQLERGLRWYANARQICEDLATRHGVSVETAAGVVSALSPQNRWHSNVKDADTLLATGDCKGLATSRRKAQTIANGARPMGAFDPATAPKTRSFYMNLLCDQSDAVTIDMHAVDAAGLDDWYADNLTNAGRYEAIATAYRHLARHLDCTPPQAQAIAWVCFRENYRNMSAA